MQAFLDGVIWFRGSLAEDSFFSSTGIQKIVMSKSKKTQKIESRQTPMQDILKQTKGVWSHHRLKLFIGVALIAVTLTIFWPVQDLEFVDFDDDVYVTHNTHVQLGLTWESFIWSFATTYSSEWHPLTWLSHMADYELYGLNPKGHHFTN